MDVDDVGRTDHAQIVFFKAGVEKPGDEVFENLLPDVGGEVPFDERKRGFARAETLEMGLGANVFTDLNGLLLYIAGRDRDLKLVLTTFN
jgi:hypothetical protein